MTIEWSLTEAFDAIAAAVPDREMLVWHDARRTYAEVAGRAKGLAGFLVDRGVGIRRDRSALERWECGQVPVALVMHNRPEYLETMLACYRARAVPFNVNHQYRDTEIRALLDQIRAGAIVYQRSMAPLLAAALDERHEAVLVDIDDGSEVAALAGSVGLESAIEAGTGATLPDPTGDDLYLVCTGGTTGTPKGVLWRQADIFVAGMGGTDETSPASLAETAGRDAPVWFAVPPLMHAAAQWTAFAGLHQGATIVLHDDANRFDAAAILDVAAREHVTMMSIVGDAYARPLVDELRRGDYDLTALRRIGTGGAMTSMENKEALLDLLPEVTIVDGYGASETGGMAFGAMTRTFKMAAHTPAGGAVVLSADRARLLDPGDDEVGWIARRGRVPLGYLDDRAKTEVTFPIVDGERFAVPGDRGRLEPDGSIKILGRDSLVVNTGGEKVFVEEVEQALLPHPHIVDVLVVGRPSDRFGQEVVAVVQLEAGVEVDPEDLREFAAMSVARFKAPRAIAFTDVIRRHPTGKPDYRWASEAAADAVSLGLPKP